MDDAASNVARLVMGFHLTKIDDEGSNALVDAAGNIHQAIPPRGQELPAPERQCAAFAVALATLLGVWAQVAMESNI